MPLFIKICVAALAFILACSSFAQTETNSEQAQRELESVAAAIEDIRQWLISANQSETQEEQTLRETEQELTSLSLRTAATQSEITITQTELDVLQGQAQHLQQQKSAQTEILHNLIRTLYINGKPDLLKSFFSQNDPSDSARLLHYSRVLSDFQLDKISEFESLLSDLAANEETIESTLALLQEQSNALENQQTALAQLKTEKELALTNLRASISAKGNELQNLEANQAELQRLIEEIRIAMEGIRSFADVPPIVNSKGQLPAPVDGSVGSRFGQTYGDGNLTRQGITLQAQTGTPVTAVHAGHVVFADWLRGSGLLVIVDHGQGYMSLYGSNEALSVSSGSWVDTGDVLATSGIPLNSEEPGLYFEIRHHGQPQNPSDWLNLRP